MPCDSHPIVLKANMIPAALPPAVALLLVASMFDVLMAVTSRLPPIGEPAEPIVLSVI
ncbi:MAG: hypothetical protein GY708_25820, partial [Actinomycetia bacterium]|nr:hypothetical protein [Actinomycetes bacterium]